MLTADLSVTDNGTGLTNVGGAGALTFALVANPADGSTLRRVAATASTTPQEIAISHSTSGKGLTKRNRTLVKATHTVVNVDTTTTGGVAPSASVYIVFDYPPNLSAHITDQIKKNLAGQIIGVIQPSGALAKLFNLES
jgi:hypothetical protein